MKRILLTCAFAFATALAWAQFPSEVWHEGELVLLEGDTLKGFIKYNLETDLVQYSKDEKTIKTYTARKVLYYELFDTTSNRYRRFYVLPYSLTNGYKAPIMFELILEGKKMTLLSREAIEYEVATYPYSVSGTYTRLRLTYTHYFLTEEGKIERFNGKKNDLLYGIMSDRSSEVKKFIKTNRLRAEKRPDLLKIVAFYNSLFDEDKAFKD